MNSNTTDSDLLGRFLRDQDSVAFDQLARRYRAMVFTIARRITQSHHDAEDVAQNCFLELARKASSIRDSVPAFLHSTATRRAIDLLRDRNRRNKHEQKAAEDRPEPAENSGPAERDWDEISPEVDEAINRLPAEHKTLVILYFLRGLSVADISLETRLNRGMIERRLQVGIRRLRADLARGERTISAGMLAVGLKGGLLTRVPPSLTAATGRMALAAGLHRAAANPPQRRWLPAAPRGMLTWVAPAAAAIITLGLLAFAGLHWTSAAGQSDTLTPYDRMKTMYSDTLIEGETSGFSLHSAQIRNDTSSFWRGSQPLFFAWCKSNCSDWFADSNAFARCHASPNLEDAEGIAMVLNTDDSARLPVKVELLQGMIIARLATDRGTDPRGTARLAAEICGAYRDSLQADETPVQSAAWKAQSYTSSYLDSSGNFRSLIQGHQQKVEEVLRPSPIELAKVQLLVSGAMARSPKLRSMYGDSPRVHAARALVRHDSVVSQGRLFLLIELEGTAQLLELNQQTPSAAELGDAVPRDPRPPAQRAAEDAACLSPSGCAPISWCEAQGMSFTLSPPDLKPQVYELRKDRWLDPIQAGRSWATFTAATHRSDPNRQSLAECITPELEQQLARRSDAYLSSMNSDLYAFINDRRAAADRNLVEARAASWLEQSQSARD